ncbi:hypothetical protein NLJ89_g10979 [Agrocybe chaxingu]|uniref:Metallo-beta-lactamase domain-containing protein n=1 Tax=Agrocybe chaxingu TaxID=84603 RepID=A0A9W8MNF2_9AGAR|nr:hypothetical protein NLJ89_g10979 [Agrocybe chaxingu]
MSTIALNCLVSGDDPDKIFTLKIPSNENISILKRRLFLPETSRALHLTERASKRVLDAAAEFFSSLDAEPTKGAIDMGQRGENIAKMILLRAYMSATRAAHDDPNWSSGCSLVTFLKSLTGRNFQELVLDCKPNNLLPFKGRPLKEAFARSWVRFTHFGRAADDGAVTTSAACAAFVRAMSFIGWSSQKSVDVCIPILLDSDKPITEANMSAILVQIQLRSKKGSYEIDAKKIGLFPPPGSSRDCMKMVTMDVESEKYFSRPYISLVMEIGVEKLRDAQSAYVQTRLDQMTVSISNKLSPSRIGVVAHKPPTKITPRATSKANITQIHPRYSLCFYGCSPEVYGCIPKEAEHIYKFLLQLSDMVPDHPQPSSISAVLRMKPFWRTNCQSYDWGCSHGGGRGGLGYEFGHGRKDWVKYPPGIIKLMTGRTYPVQVDLDVVDSLQKGGTSPTEIDYVCVSHCHCDHVNDTTPFTKSTFLVGSDAQSLFKLGYPEDPTSHFASDLLPGRTKFLNPTDWTPIGPFPRALDFFGDGSLYVLDPPEHLVGHINILARTSSDGGWRWIYLGGDSAHHWNFVTLESGITGANLGQTVFCAHIDKEAAQEHTLNKASHLMYTRRRNVRIR